MIYLTVYLFSAILAWVLTLLGVPVGVVALVAPAVVLYIAGLLADKLSLPAVMKNYTAPIAVWTTLTAYFLAFAWQTMMGGWVIAAIIGAVTFVILYALTCIGVFSASQDYSF